MFSKRAFAMIVSGVVTIAVGAHRCPRRIAIALLLANAACPAHGNSVDTAPAPTQPAPGPGTPQDIVVTGQRLFGDVVPERNLDQDAIESYGVSTVDDLIGEVQAELGEGEDPVILVNGERVDSLQDIGAYPVEILRNLQVLPRGSAVRVGGRTGQRVISLTLKRNMRAVTLTAAPKIATDGDWHAGRGEALFTFLHGVTRANIGFRVRDESSLLESERGIIQPEQNLPFAIEGNIVGFPNTAGEIDPVLSALAGHVVTVARVPGSANPTLADFASGSDQENSTNLGQFRTLRPNTRNYDFNGTFNTRLAPWLSSNVTLHLNRNTSDSLRGLPSASFILPVTNKFSPFSRDVTLESFGQDPLRSRSVRESGEARLTLNGKLGRWLSKFDARHSESSDKFDSDRQTFGFIALDDDIDPFTSKLSKLIPLQTNRSTSQTVTNFAQLSFTGPAFDLPAGPVLTTVESSLSWYSLSSQSTFAATPDRRFRRHAQAVRGAVDVPLTSRDNNVLAAIGDLGASAEYSRTHFSDAGSLDYYAFALNWQPIVPLQLRASIERDETPPLIRFLGDPIIEIPVVRIFDPVTGNTVDVNQITGGNPGLRPERSVVRRLSAQVTLDPRLNLQLNAEYTDTDQRNYISSLPPTSLPVMLAFPDRFIRDPDGNLVTVDLRPVNFDSHREKRLRWGLSLRAKLSGGTPAASRIAKTALPVSGSGEASRGEAAVSAPAAAPRHRSTPSTYIQLTANHTVVFSDTIDIRPGLDTVDLLGGGAIGIGGGRLRQQVDTTIAITSGGVGARVGATWRGPSTLDTRIGGITDTLHFSPVFLINVRLFADARRFFPSADWAKDLRFSLDVVNATNDRQKVRDSFGNTPLQYQPGYRDPLGRTIEFEIRKVF